MTFSRRQIETTIAALVAIVAAIVGLSLRDEEELGPKFLALERVGRFQQPTYLTQPPGRDSPLFVVERQGRPPVVLDYLLVGVIGSFQPDKLARAFEGDDDGIIARKDDVDAYDLKDRESGQSMVSE